MPNPATDMPANLEVLLDIPVRISVELGACQLPMQEVLQLGPGSVVQLDQPSDAPVDLFVNGRLVARGEVVVLDDKLGIKITEVIGKSSPAPAAESAAPRAQPEARSVTPVPVTSALQP